MEDSVELYYKGHFEHPKHHFARRAAYSIALIFAVLLLGTLGFHYIEHYPYIYSFYFTSMLATGEGPIGTPTTALGMIFASALAFVSIGTVIIALVYLFGPFFGRFLKFSEEKVKKEERVLEKDLKKKR